MPNRRLLAAALIAVAAVLPWEGGVTAHEGLTPSGEATPVDVFVPADESAPVNLPQLIEHHAKLVEQREQVQEVRADYQERVARDLGDRAPTETIAPMPTVPPPVD